MIFFVIFQTGAQVAKISLVGASLTNAGLVLGLGNPTARSNDQTNRGDSGNLSKRYVEKLDQKCSKPIPKAKDNISYIF